MPENQVFGRAGGGHKQVYPLKPLETELLHARRGFVEGFEIGTVDSNIDVPFQINRAFYIYDTLEGVVRGNHANKKSQFALICLSGSCRVRVRRSADDNQDEIFLLDQPHKVLIMSELTWKEMYDFTPEAVLLCLSSEKYDSNEYIRKFNDFLAISSKKELYLEK